MNGHGRKLFDEVAEVSVFAQSDNNIKYNHSPLSDVTD
jgi:hypothetical protein